MIHKGKAFKRYAQLSGPHGNGACFPIKIGAAITLIADHGRPTAIFFLLIRLGKNDFLFGALLARTSKGFGKGHM